MTSTTDHERDVSDRDTLPLCPPSPNSSLELDESLIITEEEMNNVSVEPSGSLSDSDSDQEEYEFLTETRSDSSLRTYKTDKVVKKPGGSFRYMTRRTGTYYADGTEIIQIFKLEDGFLIAHSTDPDPDPDITSETVDEGPDGNESGGSAMEESHDEEPSIIFETVDGFADRNPSASAMEESHDEEPVSDNPQPSPNPSTTDSTTTGNSVDEEESEDQKTESDLSFTKAEDETDIQMIPNDLIPEAETDKPEVASLNPEKPVASELKVATLENDVELETRSKDSTTTGNAVEEESEDQNTEADLPSTRAVSHEDETDIQRVETDLIPETKAGKVEDPSLSPETPVTSELKEVTLESDIGLKTLSKEEGQVNSHHDSEEKMVQEEDSVRNLEGMAVADDIQQMFKDVDEAMEFEPMYELKESDKVIQELKTSSKVEQEIKDSDKEVKMLADSDKEVQVVEDPDKEAKVLEDSAKTLKPLEDSDEDVQVLEDSAKTVKLVEDSKKEVQVLEDSDKAAQVVEDSAKKVQAPEDSAKEVQVPEDSAKEVQAPEDSAKKVQVLEDPDKSVQVRDNSDQEVQTLDKSGEVPEELDDSLEFIKEVINTVEVVQELTEAGTIARQEFVVSDALFQKLVDSGTSGTQILPKSDEKAQELQHSDSGVTSVRVVPSDESMHSDVVLAKEVPRTKKKKVRVKAAQEIEIEEEMVPFVRQGKPNFFWNGLDEDDTLLVESRKRPHGMNSMCALCYEWFETTEETRVHMKEVHLNGTKFHECDVCGHKFLAKFLLERHAKLHKFDPKHPASCYVSGKTKLPKPGRVENHYLEREKRGRISEQTVQRISEKMDEIASQAFQCIECNAEFSSDKDVLEHFEKSHALKKCIFCSVACFTFRQLKRHFSKVHKYECSESFQAGYWKFWAKAKEQGNGSGSNNVDFFHNYSKSRHGPDAEYYFEQLAQFEQASKFSRRSLEEEDKVVERSGTQSPESVETRVSGEERPRKVRKKAAARDLSHLHHNHTDLQCSICSRVFPDAKDLETHYRSHAGERSFCCQYCGRRFATHSNRREHERIHSGDRPYVCSFCKKAFIQVSNLKKHMAMHMKKSADAELECTTCGKLFLKESSLILHQRAHASERKFRCHLCHKAYNYASLLKRHIRIHSGEKPYECDMCGLLFHELVSLHYHRKKIHTGERPHKCKECGRAFILSSDLKKHMVIHTKQALTASREEDEEKEDQFQADLDLDLIGIEEPVTELKSKRSKSYRRNISFGLETLQHSHEHDVNMELDDIQEERASDSGSPASF